MQLWISLERYIHPTQSKKQQLQNMANKHALILYKMTNENAYGTWNQIHDFTQKEHDKMTRLSNYMISCVKFIPYILIMFCS